MDEIEADASVRKCYKKLPHNDGIVRQFFYMLALYSALGFFFGQRKKINEINKKSIKKFIHLIVDSKRG